ncbi:MAG: chromosome segregation protein SMC [Clostridiales bacterium]|nr:chromosome segregation protein SMC [Clostridiales bacterium]MDY6116683.1 chromosome segregation protein SMC [Anaerovoracaceae bacterium]
MYFKRLEMHGFKSFADPVVIEFHEGITCVVGPNGSGKSNISDAIRWVLGEQSPKTLRGGKMEEVIFAGSASRKLRGMAEVTLVIDNTNGTLDIDYSEVSITRRMYRSGESEYLINNAPCRLRDIRELIMDTGIGVDGYSIIGQGRIADIVSNKPESRREIFEEAAGVVSYKTRKQDAERRLETTNTNLLRANDIINEIESRIDELRDDSEKAKEYLSLKSQYESSEVNVILRNIENIQDKSEKMDDDIFRLGNEITVKSAEREEVEKILESAENDIKELNEKSDYTNRKLLQVIQSINEHENKKKIQSQKYEFLSSEELRLKQEIESFSEKLSVQEKQFMNSNSELNQLIQTVQASQIELDKSISEYNKVDDDKNRTSIEIDNLKERILRLSRDISKSENEKTEISSMNSLLEKRYNEILEELSQTKENYNKINQKFLDEESREQNIQKESELIQTDLLAKQKSVEEQIEKIKTQENQISADKLKSEQLLSRKKTIEEMEANYEGYNYGVKYIMKSRVNGIRGVVGELMLVPEGLEVAIETALGGNLQNIICDSDRDAKMSINILKQNNAGRLTFLPISSIRANNADVPPSVKLDKDFIGIASDMISYDHEYDEIFRYLLGRIIIVETMDSAIRLSKGIKGGFRIVTRGGEIINSSGAITGGRYKNKSANLLSRRGEIVKLENEIRLLSEDIKLNEQSLHNLKVFLSDTKDTIEEMSSRLNKNKILSSSLQSKLSMYKDSMESVSVKKDKLEQQLYNINEDRSSSSAIFEKLNTSGKDLNNELIKLEKELEKLIDTNNVVESNLKALNEKKLSKTIEHNSIKSKIENLETITERIESEIENLKSVLITRNDRLNSIVSEKQDISDGHLLPDISKMEEERIALDDALILISKEKDDVASRLSKATKEITSIRESIEKLQSQKVLEEIKLAKNQTQIENLTQRLWDEFEMSIAQATDMKDPNFVMATGIKIGRETRKRLRELGDVNIGAIKEYEEVSKRYEFLKEQREDILDAMNELNSIISDMSTTIKKKFKASFNQIVTNFEDIFVELFGGGYAELTLENEDDPLNSGIEIVAQPPGKKLQNINLMSGGEKTMTAIALMFAVLKAKPTPFCILDEVEAALDDGNIDRFSQSLKKFENIQFVLVTHQKATMEHADVLYGVTMAEQGVSNLLSLKLGDNIDL